MKASDGSGGFAEGEALKGPFDQFSVLGNERIVVIVGVIQGNTVSPPSPNAMHELSNLFQCLVLGGEPAERVPGANSDQLVGLHDPDITSVRGAQATIRDKVREVSRVSPRRRPGEAYLVWDELRR